MGPVRTCVGCRERDLRSVLLRVTVAEDGGTFALVPDPDHRRGGRGASVHLDPTCLDAAERRRAFGRALRRAGPLDTGALRTYVAAVRGRRPGEQSPGGSTLPAPSSLEAGTER